MLMKNAHNDIANIKSFVSGLIRPYSSMKQTIILFYSIIALSIFWYWPTPSPFQDSLGNRSIPSGTVVWEKSEEAGNVPDNPLFLEDVFSKKNSSETIVTVSWKKFFWGSQKIVAAFFLMGLFPILIVKFVFREKLSDYGVQWGQRFRTFNNIIIFFPLMILLGILSSRESGFYSVYPYNPYAFASLTFLVTHSILYFFLYYFSWEFMFRGFIQHGLASSMNAMTAVWIQVLLSTMLHYGHPISEVLGCLGGGFLWGFLVYRTNSIFAGWVQHAVLGIALDVSLIWFAFH
ncbi:MAG: type II CAAX endopeptidase family protein [Planctomycetia bacterium]|nr:type II CAAX endopeptidase family protein [Planctomycetia bacterium]